jgi:Zn-dependent protease with chaperone function
MHHLYFSVAGSIAAAFVGLFVSCVLFAKAVRLWGKSWRIAGTGDLAALTALLLIFSLLTFAATPAANAISRASERAADRYALALTENAAAGISAFQTLAVTGLSQVNPPALVKIFRYTHPTMLERISYLEQFTDRRPSNSGLPAPE